MEGISLRSIYFSNILDLRGGSPITSSIIWSMVIFLIVLITGLIIAFTRQIKPSLKGEITKEEKTSGKGF